MRFPFRDKIAQGAARAGMIIGTVEMAKPVRKNQLRVPPGRKLRHGANDLRAAYPAGFTIRSYNGFPKPRDPHFIFLPSFEK